MPAPMRDDDSNEALRLSAPLAAREAPRLCRRSQADCSWYHGVWQYLRLLGLVTTPRDHAEFLLAALGAEAASGRCHRVLVCGAADYATLAEVVRAYRDAASQPAITVVDLCETPLFLNRWYAERAGVAVRTDRSDILRYQPAARFDVITTHCFLGNFRPDERRTLIERWAALLAPGGKLITVNRVRPATAEPLVGFSENAARAFRERALIEAERQSAALDIAPGRLADLALAYAERKRTYPVRSREELIELIEGAGLKLVCFATLSPPERATVAENAGPSVRALASEHVKIVATLR